MEIKCELKEKLTPSSIIADIVLRRQKKENENKAYLIVEGPDDLDFFSNLTNKDKCEIITACGKTKAIEAIQKSNEEKVNGILAVLDSDYSMLDDNYKPIKNILLTDQHDLECLILKSPTLEKALTNYNLMDVEKEIGKKYNLSLREFLIEKGKSLGFLRWFVYKEKLNLKFKDLTVGVIERFMDDHIQINLKKILEFVILKSENCQADLTLLEKNIKLLEDNYIGDLWHICQGHDLINILYLCIKKFGIKSSRKKNIISKISCSQLGNFLIYGYDRSFFLDTDLFGKIRNWENENKPFIILIEFRST